MLGFFHQLAATVRIAILGLPSRIRMSLATVGSVTMVTLVLLGFLSMAAGFRETVAGAGSQTSAVVLADGASSELNSAIDASRLVGISAAPGLAVDGDGPVISGESYTVISAIHKGGSEASITLRGVGEKGLAVRPQARLVAGRMFNPGQNEIVAGRAVADQYRDFKLGHTVRLAGMDWTIVGIFDANGSVMTSEVWTDQRLISQFFGAGGALQSIRVRLASAESLGQFRDFVTANPASKLSVSSEKEFYATQARGSTNLILYIGWPLAIAMAIGAMAAALNTMFTSVATRAHEIATLRTLGFGSSTVFVSVMTEATILVVVGALLGIGSAFIVFDGYSVSTVGANMSQVMFSLKLTWRDAVQALGLATVIGVFGGLLPSWHASRRPLIDAVRD